MINIILGPPGTGKTTELLNICQQKKEQGVPWNKIGFFSFSKKAAREARDRAGFKFQASRDDLVNFKTLHSFAFRHLPVEKDNLMKGKHWKELSDLIGFNLVVNENDDSIYTNSNFKYLNLINTARIKDVTLKEEYSNSSEIFNPVKLDYLNRTIKKYKKDNDLFDFTDMIVDYTNDTFSTQFDVLFIDEAQDMPRIQYNMVDKLMSHSKETYIAGDDDQAIFRWMGADVDKFIALEGKVTVLNKSYRCPQLVYDVANSIISKVRNRREKNWRPKAAEGQVKRMSDIKHINMTEGNWLLLGRTKKIRNEMIENYLFNEGYWYGRGEHRPVSMTIIKAIEIWKRLKQGVSITFPELKSLYSKISSKGYLKRGAKTHKEEDEKKLFTLQDLHNDKGLLVDGEWYEVLSALTPKEISYLRRLERIGEDIQGDPRIKVSTIHQAKGGECDNVVVLLSLGRLVYKSYMKNPDDEHRVFYVAVTRAKEKLYLVESPSITTYKI